MQQKHLVQPFQNAMSAYSSTGIMDQDFIAQLSDSLSADFLVQVSVGDFESRSETGTSGLSGDVRSYDQEETRLYGRVWQGWNGQLGWEGFAQAGAFESELTYISAEAEEFYHHATVELVSKLSGVQESR